MYERPAAWAGRPDVLVPAQQAVLGNAGYAGWQTTSTPGIQWSGNLSDANYVSAASLVSK